MVDVIKKKAYIGFDFDHDLELKNSLIGQSKREDSPFEIIDMSITEAVDSKWKMFARERIRKCDVVILICGKHTDTAAGVAAEVTIAQELNKPYFLLRGRPNDVCKKPGMAKSSDKIYDWTWVNLKNLLAGYREL